MLYPYYVALWGTFAGMSIAPTCLHGRASADVVEIPGSMYMMGRLVLVRKNPTPAFRPLLDILASLGWLSLRGGLLTRYVGTQDVVWQGLMDRGWR